MHAKHLRITIPALAVKILNQSKTTATHLKRGEVTRREELQVGNKDRVSHASLFGNKSEQKQRRKAGAGASELLMDDRFAPALQDISPQLIIQRLASPPPLALPVSRLRASFHPPLLHLFLSSCPLCLPFHPPLPIQILKLNSNSQLSSYRRAFFCAKYSHIQPLPCVLPPPPCVLTPLLHLDLCSSASLFLFLSLIDFFLSLFSHLCRKFVKFSLFHQLLLSRSASFSHSVSVPLFSLSLPRSQRSLLIEYTKLVPLFKEVIQYALRYMQGK